MTNNNNISFAFYNNGKENSVRALALSIITAVIEMALSDKPKQQQ